MSLVYALSRHAGVFHKQPHIPDSNILYLTWFKCKLMGSPGPQAAKLLELFPGSSIYQAGVLFSLPCP